MYNKYISSHQRSRLGNGLNRIVNKHGKTEENAFEFRHGTERLNETIPRRRIEIVGNRTGTHYVSVL